MVSHIKSFAFSGLNVIEVDVQVHVMSGMPSFTIVGLADKAVTESRERVRTALSAIGLALPPKRITVNLSPADLQKEGSHFDLPIALGLLCNLGAITQESVANHAVLGELSLDGKITPVSGILPAAIGATAREFGIICPSKNGREACWAGDLDIIAPNSLLELINHLKGLDIIPRPNVPPKGQGIGVTYPDMKDIKGQATAKRALEITAAGGHNLLMTGPPGSGKSMLAKRLPSILPPLESDEILEVSMVKSIVGQLVGGDISCERPFRDPHHNCSMPALVGGGSKAKPGEVTLAHKGILFLDELPEFPRQVLDSLRQPLETKEISVARVQSHVTYPSDFQLIAAMNPCRCGYLDDASRACSKAPRCAVDYQSKISGPLLDRIDIHVDVPAINPMDIYKQTESESSEDVRKRVKYARDIQKERNRNNPEPNKYLNSYLDGEELFLACNLEKSARDLLEQAVSKMGLSMRGHNRVLRVARTIADLEGSKDVTHRHLAESLNFRQLSFKKDKSFA